MWLIKMAWKNIWRNKNRTLITMAAIFFAVILSVVTSSLYQGVFDNLIRNMVSFYSGYVQVHQQGYWNEQVLDNSFENSAATTQLIRQQRNISDASPRLESFALASSADITRGCLVVGVNPEKEDAITGLKQKLVTGQYPGDKDRSVLLTQGLADKLKLRLHDTIVLVGQGYHGATAAGKYPISGIIKYGSPDLNDKLLFMPLALAQDLYGTGDRITSLALSLKDPGDLHATAALLASALGKDFEVMTWEEIMPDILQHMKTDTNNLKIIQGILYLLICFGIFGTLIMMMVERKFEMGMLVAIGMKKSRLTLLLLAESVVTVFSGCVLGLLASLPLVYYLHRHPIRFSGDISEIYERFGFEAIWPTAFESRIFITQALVVLVIGLILSIYPVYKIIRLQPVQAMRR